MTALEVFRARRLDITTGRPMGTPIVGEPNIVFEALQESFQAADAVGDLVMVGSISNCCPLPSSLGTAPIRPVRTSE